MAITHSDDTDDFIEDFTCMLSLLSYKKSLWIALYEKMYYSY